MGFKEYFDQCILQATTAYISQKNPELASDPEKLQRVCKGFILNLDQTSNVYNFRNDFASVATIWANQNSFEQYVQEVCYLIFKQIDEMFAATHVSPLTRDKYLEIFNSSQEAFLQKLKDFKIVQIANNDILHDIFSIFQLRQYAYEEGDPSLHVKVEEGDVVIDGGACTGDSALWFYNEGASKVYSFEPIASTCSALKMTLTKNNHDPKLAFPLALTDSKRTLRFLVTPDHVAGCKDFSQILKIGNKTEQEVLEEKHNSDFFQNIQGIALDDWCAEHNVVPDFIKLDLEGAEIDALNGMSKTISTYKPKLAVCLYHAPSHMWLIPKLLHELNPNYTFYCKKSAILYEFVLFAIDRTKNQH